MHYSGTVIAADTAVNNVCADCLVCSTSFESWTSPRQLPTPESHARRWSCVAVAAKRRLRTLQLPESLPV